MKILVIGCGSIGTRHMRNLLALGYRDLLVYDADPVRRDEVAARLKLRACESIARGLDEAELVLICTPADSHVPLALLGLKKNNAVFIEKPLSTSLTGVDKLRRAARNRVMVGFNVRFHPMVTAIQNALPRMGTIYSAHMEYAYFLPGARGGDYAKGYAAKKGKGGGVILDHLHEIDYAIALFGKVRSVFGSAQKISKLNISTEDTADIVLRFAEGFDCSLHLDYLQKAYSRSIKIVAEKGIVEGDFASGRLKITEYGRQKTTIKRFGKGFDETYRDEMRHLMRCLKSGARPSIGVDEAAQSLRVALAIKRSVSEKKVIAL